MAFTVATIRRGPASRYFGASCAVTMCSLPEGSCTLPPHIAPLSAQRSRLCVILEPMQELMSRHKTYNLSPRDCLKTCLFQKWQRMVAPPAGHPQNFKTEIFTTNHKKEPTRQTTTKRRKRKNSASSASNSSLGNNAHSKKRSPAANFSLSTQVPDVMVVGEPTLMGGEFGDEDERLITRLENTQYDAANGIDDEDDFNNSPALGNNSPWNSKPPNSQDPKPESTAPQPSQ
ncbi:hypothetical protein SKAU_G00039830 [Synaphobranchus kaupii]|uniref:LIM interaction domain-containing protein n=1 Tax=Synaphobranchus kaupii TaxID=118154 RepID=A0A9Q1JGH9_SYNKA|nr:hypothetical protein SKAU_G00039830 [Synaphobranchus kaupii]